MKLNNQTINFDKLEQVAQNAISTLETSQRLDAKRWGSAIKKAVAELENNPFWQFSDGEMIILSETSGEIYQPNGKCGCRAFAENKPCKHRAMHRLLTRYSEIH